MASGKRKEYELLFKLKGALGPNFNSSFKSAMKTTQQLQDNLGKINKTSGKINGYKKQSDAIKNNQKRLEDLREEHEKLQREINETETPSESLRKKFEKNARQIEKATSKMDEQKDKLVELKKELQGAGVDTDNLESSNRELARSYETIKKRQEDIARLTAQQRKNQENIAKTKRELLKTAGVMTAVGAAIYAGPIKGSMEFQKSIAKISTMPGVNYSSLKTMEKDILKLSNSMGVSATLIAEDVYNAISAGQKPADAVAFVSQATKLAKGGFAETGQALDVLTTILNAYGMKSSESVKASDILIQTQNKGKVTVAELASTMGKIIPTAKANNVALEQLGAGYAKMTSKGIASAETTTYMNSMLNELGKTGSKSDKALRKTTGSSFKELMKDGKSLASVLEILNNSAKKDKLNLSDMFGSQEAGKAALTIMSDGVEKFNDSIKEMTESTGVAEKAFNKMMDTDETKADKAKNSIKNLSLVIGNTFLPEVGEGAEKLTELVTKLSKFAQENPKTIKSIMKLSTGLIALKTGGLLGKLGFLKMKGAVLAVRKTIKLFKGDVITTGTEAVKSVSGMKKSVDLLKGSFSLLTGPVGLTIGAIAAVTTGVLLFKDAQRKARQQVLNFSKDLGDSADNFDKVNNKVSGTKDLITEYRNLEEQVKNVTTSTEEAAAAKERMKEIEDLLIEQNPDVISRYDQENGKISENLDFIERKLDKELELARIQYEQKQYEAEQKLPDALKEIAKLNEKTESLREQYDASKQVRDGLKEITQEWEVFYTQDHSQEELTSKLKELEERASRLGETIGKSWSFNGSGMAGISTTYMEYDKNVSSLVDKLTKTKDELSTTTQSVKEYYDASVKLTELDLGGGFNTASQKLQTMNNELKTLEDKGEGGSKRALELKEKIEELEPKIETAAAQIRDLGLAVKDVPEVKTINVEEATKNIDGFIKKLDQIPTSKRVQLIMQQGQKISGYATGGIITKPTLATFAEKSPEAAIPIDGSSNAKRLWLKTGQLLGMNTRSLLPQLQLAYSSNISSGVNEVPSVSNSSLQNLPNITIHNQPVIHISGETPEDLDEKLKENNENLLYMINERIRQQEEDERRNRYA
ncbi:phage tail tape measure protein [Vallitalea guaymasensis]|uniref:phage tail tape measure protein n=1 Tax=Vallitalea guaymasensis TaxID=1185412 RepID=UPI000DE446A4|nr:phage tail tape measure protein [Vallitalea guaymasensis]